jgi:cysteine desulfurase/selenocysteine lyase
VTLYGPQPQADGSGRAALATFTVEGSTPRIYPPCWISRASRFARATTAPSPCTGIWGSDSTARASLYFYNTKEEIDVFIAALKDTIDFFKSVFEDD